MYNIIQARSKWLYKKISVLIHLPPSPILKSHAIWNFIYICTKTQAWIRSNNQLNYKKKTLKPDICSIIGMISTQMMNQSLFPWSAIWRRRMECGGPSSGDSLLIRAAHTQPASYIMGKQQALLNIRELYTDGRIFIVHFSDNQLFVLLTTFKRGQLDGWWWNTALSEIVFQIQNHDLNSLLIFCVMSKYYQSGLRSDNSCWNLTIIETNPKLRHELCCRYSISFKVYLLFVLCCVLS